MIPKLKKRLKDFFLSEEGRISKHAAVAVGAFISGATAISLSGCGGGGGGDDCCFVAGTLVHVSKTKTKPIEELYDTREDPYEVNNLASDPRFHDILEKLRDEHLRWKEETRDWGLIPETELIKKLWPPDGIQPITQEPDIILENLGDSEQLKVIIHCDTEGASIAYMLNDTDRWLLYSEPIHVPGDTRISVQSIRIGYKPSAIVTRELLTSIDKL